MASIDNIKKSGRFLQSRRYTHDTFTDAQEAFTSVLDINAGEIYIDHTLIPSSGLPYNSSGQDGSIYSNSGQQVMKYYYRQTMTKSDTNNEVWFFLVPTGSTSGVGAGLINGSQQINFISPKYSISSLANSNKGLLIMGAKGIGKTINFIVYRSIQAKLNGIGLRIINVKQLETQFKIQGEAYIQELIDCDELLLDDIGSEPRSIKDFGTDRNLVNDILIQRYNRFQRGSCITHATTNLNVQMLTEHYDTRLIDRMKEMFILKKITSETQSKRA